MLKFELVQTNAPAVLDAPFEVGYTDGNGQQRLPLTEVLTVLFEACLRVRTSPAGVLRVGDASPSTATTST